MFKVRIFSFGVEQGMALTIGNNISSLLAQRQLQNSNSSLAKTFERLSSGQRINKAADDAAGLSVAESLRTKSKVFTQGVRNFNDGVSLLNVADGALNELTNIVTRIVELAEQAASGVLSNTQRSALDEEAQQLRNEYFRISKSTKFNGRNLFEADFGALRLQGGFGVDGGFSGTLGGKIGLGSFDSATSFNSNSFATYAVQLGDLNGDGILDMVSGGLGGVNTLSLRFGDGTGSFGTATSLASGTRINAIELVDIDNDGNLDIVSAGTSGTGFVDVRLGDGSGNFAAAISFATGTNSATDIEVGDINGDGNLDIFAVGVDGSYRITLSTSLGNGDGTFGTATTMTPSTKYYYATGLAAGDINGDGVLDLILVGRGDGPTTNRAIALTGNENGTFSFDSLIAMESYRSYAVQLEDLNGDGILDMITAGHATAGDSYVSVRLGDGSGSFGNKATFTSDFLRSTSFDLGDLNGDGHLDLVVNGFEGLNGYSAVRLGNGDGTFGAVTTYNSETRRGNAVVLGDVDGDGVLDQVTAGRADAGGGFSTVSLNETTNGIAPLLEFSLQSLSEAKQALPVMQRKLEQITEQRGIIGAFQARAQIASQTFASVADQYTAAESRIRDIDYATEVANSVRLTILQESAAAIIAQANQQPQIVLSLLQ